MKEKILKIIENNPRHYTKIIKNDEKLNEWILSNSYESENYAERIYVSTIGIPSKMPCGKYPKFNTYFKGFFNYCGPKTVCECARNDHSYKIKNIKKDDIKKQEILNKRKNTMIEKYGTDNAMRSMEILNKLKNTNLEKYGVEFPLQNEDIKEKIKNTNLEKYGVEFLLQSKEIQNKIKNSLIEKYGENYMEPVRNKGYEIYNGNPFQNDEIKNHKKTMIEKYGVEHPLQSKDIFEKMIEKTLQNMV